MATWLTVIMACCIRLLRYRSLVPDILTPTTSHISLQISRSYFSLLIRHRRCLFSTSFSYSRAYLDSLGTPHNNNRITTNIFSYHQPSADSVSPLPISHCYHPIFPQLDLDTILSQPHHTSIIMCMRVIEKYAVCGCIYHVHGVDACAAYGQHGVSDKVVQVGYACPTHMK
jgi:hypothetical protein